MDHLVSLLATALTRSLLISSLVQPNTNFTNYGQYQPQQPIVALQDPIRDQWSRIDDKGVRVPVAIGALQHANGQVHLPAMEKFGPFDYQDGETRRVIRLLNSSPAKLILRPDPRLYSTYRHAVANNNNQLPTIFNQLPYDPVSDRGNDSAGLPVNSGTNDSMRNPANNSTALPGNNDMNGLDRYSEIDSTALLTNNAATDSNIVAAASYMTPQPSGDGVSNGILRGPIAATTATQDTQPSLMVGRVELPSIEGPVAVIPGKPKRRKSCSFSDSVLVRDLITGRERKRISTDDFPGCVRTKYKSRWRILMSMDKKARGTIVGYESGDSDLDFSEWEEAKEKRNKRTTKKRKLSRR
jgi:hypothetical protein